MEDAEDVRTVFFITNIGLIFSPVESRKKSKFYMV